MRGTQDAFVEFATAESTRLVRMAFLLTGDTGIAEDLVQDVLERLFVVWSRVEDPRAYSHRAIVNRSRNVWRRRRRHPETPLTESHDRVVADRSEQLAEHDAIVELLANLPQRQRAALVLRYFNDLSEAETAAIMSCSVGAVKTHTSRGLSRLRTELFAADSPAVAAHHARSSE